MLTFRNIQKQFTHLDTSQTLFNHFNLSISKGSFTVIAGANGSGKSTLLSLLTGDLQPDQGHIQMGDVPLSNLLAHERMRFIRILRQDPSKGTVGSLSVLENLILAQSAGTSKSLLPLLPKGQSLKTRRTSLKTHLQILEMGLEEKLDTPACQLSGGQRQALALMMIAFSSPELLLLDEHTAALDPKSSHLVMAYTQKLISEKNMSALMVTHDLNDAIHYGDRLIFLRAGQVVLDVSGQEKKALTLEHLIPYFSNHPTSLII